MFSRVLIAEGFDHAQNEIADLLEQMEIPVAVVEYCDDAYIRIKRGILDQEPFDLYITDLRFKPDHRKQKFTSGEELIAALSNEHPDLKVIVYTMEDRPQKVRQLFDVHKINAYVCKGRNGLKNLEEALERVAEEKKYLSPEIYNALDHDYSLDVNDYDLQILEMLGRGFMQKEISAYFKKHKVKPASLSSVEKRINKLTSHFDAKNVTHLVAIVKDLGLI